jgi:hypothetical protein
MGKNIRHGKIPTHHAALPAGAVASDSEQPFSSKCSEKWGHRRERNEADSSTLISTLPGTLSQPDSNTFLHC